MPNVKELSSIADKSLSNPAIDSAAFPATPTGWTWTASPNTNNSSYAWYVNFGDGSVYYVGNDGYGRSNSYPMRLVRYGSTITANPSRVASGTNSTVSWTITGSEVCSISGSDGFLLQNQNTSGSASIVINTQTIYTISCSDGSSSSVKVNVGSGFHNF